MGQESDGNFAPDQGTTTFRDTLAKYLAKWPLFIVCMCLSASIGLLYIRYTVPKYIATTNFLIKGAESGKANSEDLIESALNGKTEINLNNEIRLLNASRLMEQTVSKNGLNILYFKKGRILDIDIYNSAPFFLVAKQLTDSNRSYQLHIQRIDILGGTFLYGYQNEEKLFTFLWNQPFSLSGQNFILIPKRRIDNEEGNYIVIWQPIDEAAGKLSSDLSVSAFDTKSSVIQLSLKTENLQKGKDILNALFNEYNLSDIEGRSMLFARTVQFIDDRLVAISGELKGVEGNLEAYQGSNQLIDIKGQTTQSLGNLNDASITIKDIGIQQGVASMILDYFNNPANNNKLVPTSLGLNDGTLDLLITQYNDLQLKKEREAPLVASNSTVMQDLNTQLGNLKSSILESLSNISKSLRLQENNFQLRNRQYQRFLSSIPHNERVLQEISRKQSITEGLYLYLLQKREEASILGSTANESHYVHIDPASGYGPVEPNNKKIIIFASILGLLLPISGIYLRDLFNDRIVSLKEISQRLGLPIIGEINHLEKSRKHICPVLHDGVISEQFRTIRTNLSFYLNNTDQNIILITSSDYGEGKSFISLNLASVFAMSGKKVALLEFDFRRPVLSDTLNLDSKTGLTCFLNGQVNSVSELCFEIDEIPDLHLYPAGPIEFNPADLLLSENLNRLLEVLKKRYDCIVIDSPPIGFVSDSFILGRYCDIVLYILRQGTTLKKNGDYITDIRKNKKFPSIGLILNDVKTVGMSGKHTYSNKKGNNKNKKRLQRKTVNIRLSSKKQSDHLNELR